MGQKKNHCNSRWEILLKRIFEVVECTDLTQDIAKRWAPRISWPTEQLSAFQKYMFDEDNY
jgi:hypothetical protein